MKRKEKFQLDFFSFILVSELLPTICLIIYLIFRIEYKIQNNVSHIRNSYLFLFGRILYRREKEKLSSRLSELNWKKLMVRVTVLVELKYVGLDSKLSLLVPGLAHFLFISALSPAAETL